MSEMAVSLSDEFKNIYFVPGQRDGRYPYSNSFLIGDFIIDTGISSGFLRKLRRQYRINSVILSHWHEDHISGNRLLPEATYYAHKADVPVIEDVNKMVDYYRVFDDEEQIKLFMTILEGMRLENTIVDVLINDRDLITVNKDMRLQVIHTPGHTKGHCCFLELSSKIAFLADIDLSSLGPWYGGIDSNVMEFEDSIKRLMNFNIEIAVTSHKGVVKGKSEVKQKLKDYLEIIYKRDEKILAELSENSPKKAEDLMKKNLIYPRYSEYEIYEVLAEKFMIEFHFDKYLKNQQIEAKNGGFILV